jgi:hypothetical protein
LVMMPDSRHGVVLRICPDNASRSFLNVLVATAASYILL